MTTQPLSVSELLTYATVRIEAHSKDGRTSTGSGFFFKFCESGDHHFPAVVTNKHVVKGSTRGTFLIHEGDGNGAPHVEANATVDLDNFEARWICHPDPDVDLCILPVGPLVHEADNKGKKLFYISLDGSLVTTDEEASELTAIEDVVMVGYPVGIWDSVNNMPIVRRGITATHPAKDYAGKTQFMIDAACFPGSSGSPVFLYNMGSYALKSGNIVMGGRLKLLGILYAGPQYNAKGDLLIENVPTGQQVVANSAIPTNLGLVIKSKRLRDFDTLLKGRFGAAPVPHNQELQTDDQLGRFAPSSARR